MKTRNLATKRGVTAPTTKSSSKRSKRVATTAPPLASTAAPATKPAPVSTVIAAAAAAEPAPAVVSPTAAKTFEDYLMKEICADLDYLMKEICADLGFTSGSGHAFRRIFITTLANDSGVNIEETMLSARHRSVAASRNYQQRNGVSETAKLAAIGQMPSPAAAASASAKKP